MMMMMTTAKLNSCAKVQSVNVTGVICVVFFLGVTRWTSVDGSTLHLLYET